MVRVLGDSWHDVRKIRQWVLAIGCLGGLDCHQVGEVLTALMVLYNQPVLPLMARSTLTEFGGVREYPESWGRLTAWRRRNRALASGWSTGPSGTAPCVWLHLKQPPQRRRVPSFVIGLAPLGHQQAEATPMIMLGSSWTATTPDEGRNCCVSI